MDGQTLNQEAFMTLADSPKTTLSDKLYAGLRERLVMWEIAPNEIIVESKLARIFGVSRTPVREALAQLARDGLVEPIHRVGYRVTSVSLRDLHEVFSMRELLEGRAARVAAENYREEALQNLEQSHEDWGNRLKNQKPSRLEYLRYHDSLHLGVAKLANNTRLYEFVLQLLTDGTRLRMMDPEMTADSLLDEQDESRVLLRAIRERDGDTAQRIMQEHIKSSMQRSIDHLASACYPVEVGGLLNHKRNVSHG